MKSLCSTFKRLALETWNRIEIGRRVGFQLKEETITDLLLLDLKHRHPKEIHIHEFKKVDEGRNGADWEWWFYGKGRWLGFRVQAKILNIYTGAFEHLHYKKSANGIYQCDQLITDAVKSPFPKRPFYCLYLQTDDSQLIRKMNYGNLPGLFGCSLISAYDVRNLQQLGQKKLKDVVSKTTPWHRLVCHTVPTNGDVLKKIDSFATKQFSTDSEGTETKRNSLLLHDCPSYVRQLLAVEVAVELERPDDNLDGIALFLLSE